MTDLRERTARILAVHDAAAKIADPTTPLGRDARAALVASSGLSPAGVEYALTRCLEHRASRSALTQLTRRAPPAPRAHVLLSANVVTAAFRAIVVALAQSSRVFVRSSRREPEMARLLHEGSGRAFELVEQLSPAPGDHVWAYGTSETLHHLRAELPGGVRLHAHGPGMGIAIVGPEGLDRSSDRDAFADALAQDVIAFDQRGCLSPRVVIVRGSPERASEFSEALAKALARWEQAVPRGPLGDDEQADFLRYRDTMLYAAETFHAGKSVVVLDPREGRLILPPTGRTLHVVRVSDLRSVLSPIAHSITCVGKAGDDLLEGTLRTWLGERRYVPLGQMQKPPLDGPVDLRVGWDFETL